MSTEIKINNASSALAWNKGRPVGQKRPLRPKEVWSLCPTSHQEPQTRSGDVEPRHPQQAARLRSRQPSSR